MYRENSVLICKVMFKLRYWNHLENDETGENKIWEIGHAISAPPSFQETCLSFQTGAGSPCVQFWVVKV